MESAVTADFLAIVERLGLVGALLAAVGVLWAAWAKERSHVDDMRKAFDKRVEELQNRHLEDIRLLAGINERAWRVQQTVEQYRTTEIPRIVTPPIGD